MGIVIEQNNNLYLKWEDDHSVFYDTISIYTNIPRELQLISKSNEQWTVCKSADSILKLPNVLQ